MRPLALLAASAVLLAGCSATPADSRPSVVASTNVYADLARSIGGGRVRVTALLDSAAKDPHEYEASGRDLLAVSRADLVVENGGGYDSFLTPLLDELGTAAPPVIDAVDLGALESGNEHVWYRLPTAVAVAEQIADRLTALDPAGRAAYRAALADFTTRADGLEQRIAALRPEATGSTVLATEPVPLYLLAALGVTDRTPAELTQAVEEGGDIPPAVLLDVLDRLSQHRVSLLAYNGQSATGQTERLREAASDGGVPIVDFTETLPRGLDYLGWMERNVDAVAEALRLSPTGASG
jgi:zinc/manganese transport system substrate-binding protein